jgi:uncharacterized membrane protein SirB2
LSIKATDTGKVSEKLSGSGAELFYSGVGFKRKLKWNLFNFGGWLNNLFLNFLIYILLKKCSLM